MIDPFKPTRLLNVAADCVGAMVRSGIPRDRANAIFLEELEWRLFPAGERPVMEATEGEDVIEQMTKDAPF